MDCMLSIIIPVYNGQRHIKGCVDAVRLVSCSHEILLINDGSTDDTLSYMQEAFADYLDVVIFDKENGGVYDARNYGTRKAQGRYVYYLDQDDYPLASVIDDAIERCEAQSGDMAYWSTVVEQGGMTIPCDTVLRDAVVERDVIKTEIVPTFISRTRNTYVITMAHIWGALFRREIIVANQLSFRKFVQYEDDYLFLLDYLIRSHRVCFIQEVGYHWVRHESSCTMQLNNTVNYWDKAEQLYDYVIGACHAFEIALPTEFETFIHQNIAVCALENCASIKNPRHREETCDWRRRMQDPIIRGACRQESIRRYTGRQHRLWTLIHKGLYTSAICYAYADSMRREIMGGGGDHHYKTECVNDRRVLASGYA